MKIARFLKDWTLPVAMITGTSVCLLFTYVPPLRPVGAAVAPLAVSSQPVLLFLMLFVTFSKARFHRLRPRPWHFVVAAMQVVLAAVFTLIISALRPDGDALIALEACLSIAVCPCAAAAVVVAQKLGGDVEETTAYTLLSNVIAAIVIPLSFPCVERGVDVSFAAAFIAIMTHSVVVLVVPMVLAYAVKRWLRPLHRAVVGVKDLSYYIWAVLLALVVGVTVGGIIGSDVSPMLLITIAASALTLCLIQFAAGRYIGGRYGRRAESGQSLGQKNSSFAIWIAATFLSPLAALGPGCYMVWQNIVNSAEIWHHRHGLQLESQTA